MERGHKAAKVPAHLAFRQQPFISGVLNLIAQPPGGNRMRASTRGASFLALTILFTPAGNAAQAQELLVMPYSCAVVGGRPMLSPAPEQSHSIIGQREQRSYTACSPVNPDMCRTWTVHRFDLDCGGARVPWVSVVGAAADQADGRAWAEGGRLHLRMGWQWGMAPDDPCVRGPGLDDRFGFGRMRRYCADRRALMPPPIVEMPFGFAPMLGIDGIFVKAATPGTSAAPSALPPISAAPTPPKTARVDPVASRRGPSRHSPPAPLICRGMRRAGTYPPFWCHPKPRTRRPKAKPHLRSRCPCP